jgi:hypothetical protein
VGAKNKQLYLKYKFQIFFRGGYKSTQPNWRIQRQNVKLFARNKSGLKIGDYVLAQLKSRKGNDFERGYKLSVRVVTFF